MIANISPLAFMAFRLTRSFFKLSMIPAKRVNSLNHRNRSHNDKIKSSDGVVSYSSSHLDFAESELVIPAGHGGFTHPEAIAEIVRILKLHRQNE